MPERNGGSDELGLDMFYSFNIGPVHFISINTEYYYFIEVYKLNMGDCFQK